ncbi:MAG: hypothetical protein ACOYL5_10990, partial [Phototrophicaceae bacterium]
MALIFLLTGLPTFAQSLPLTCIGIVNDALLAIEDNCNTQLVNSVCYGYNHVMTTFFNPQIEGFFTLPGHTSPLADIQTLHTAPMNDARQEWGVAVIKARADIPDTLPGQAVTFLLMGDTEVSSDPNGTTPMQAFTFRGGVGAPACDQAPNALLIQGIRGLTINLTVNGAEITLASTAVLQTLQDPTSGQLQLRISMLDGMLTANGGATVVEGGSSVHYALDDSLQIMGDPLIIEDIPDSLITTFETFPMLPTAVVGYGIKLPRLEIAGRSANPLGDDDKISTLPPLNSIQPQTNQEDSASHQDNSGTDSGTAGDSGTGSGTAGDSGTG